MKNNKFIICLIVFLILLISGISIFIYLSQNETKGINSFFDNDANKISTIYITNGNNGNITTVNNRKVISDISSYLSKLRLKRVFDKPSGGWSYSFSICENDKEVINIFFLEIVTVKLILVNTE